jgi:hypothetical protein
MVPRFDEYPWLNFPVPLKFVRQLMSADVFMNATGMPSSGMGRH